MRDRPLKWRPRNSLQKWLDEFTGHPIGLAMMEDYLAARKNGVLPPDEVMKFFEEAFEIVTRDYRTKGSHSQKAECLIKALGFASKSGPKDHKNSDRNISIAIDRENGLTYKSLGEKYNTSPDNIRKIVGGVDKTLVRLVKGGRENRALEIKFLRNALEHQKKYIGQRLVSGHWVVAPVDELPDIDFSKLNPANQDVIDHSIALIQACITVDGEMIPEDELRMRDSSTNYRMNLLVELSECFDPD